MRCHGKLFIPWVFVNKLFSEAISNPIMLDNCITVLAKAQINLYIYHVKLYKFKL